MAMEVLIWQIEGKLKPCSDMGRVAISVLNIHGKPEVAWTLAAMSLSSLSASALVIGWRVRRAPTWDAMDCMTMFLMRVIGVGPMNFGKVKASMKLWSSWKQWDGLLILTWRNSSSLGTNKTVWLVMTIGDTLGLMVIEGIVMVLGWVPAGERTKATVLSQLVYHP